jgi:hypothetical protein
VTARIFLSCTEHPDLLVCDDDEAFRIETVAAARALWAAKHPGKDDTKAAQVVIDCEIGGCSTRAIMRADSIVQGRAMCPQPGGSMCSFACAVSLGIGY